MKKYFASTEKSLVSAGRIKSITSGKLDQEVLDITGKGKEIELNWGAPSERSNKNENEIDKEIRPIKKYKGNAESDQGIVEDEIKTASS